MAWTTYAGRGSKGEFAFPVVTVHQSGVIALSERAYAVLGEPAAVDLLYDHETPNKIGLRASAEGAYTPRVSQNGKSWSCVSGHTPTETQRYRPPAITDGVLEGIFARRWLKPRDVEGGNEAMLRRMKL